MPIRTDMAMEAKRLWERSAQDAAKLPGVTASQRENHGVCADVVEIISEEGAKILGKPVGTYITLDLTAFLRKQRGAFRDAASALGEHLSSILPPCSNVLVVCLGNQSIAADAVGPETMKKLVVTRHLTERRIAAFANFCSLSAVAPGVLGKTGIESLELVLGASKKVKPDCVIAVDALASCEPERLCMSVQITDTGIMPGSGIGNHRMGFTSQTLGVPVIAIGVPTLMDGQTFLEIHGNQNGALRSDLVMTMRDIDVLVGEIGELIAYGIDLAIHPQLTLDDIPGFLS